MYFVGQKYFPAGIEPAGVAASPPRIISLAMEQIDEYFAHERTVFALKLHLEGTDFQKRVWAALQEISFGTAWSYGDLARQLGFTSNASRAVGSANSRNPISIIVPCHRVIGATGEITGYAGGVERKQHLLTHEGGPGRAQLTLF